MVVSIRKAILKKLYKKRIIGGKHTAIENLPKGFPRNLHKEVLMVANELFKEGLLIKKPTSYGLHVSLNPRMIEKILEEIGGAY